MSIIPQRTPRTQLRGRRSGRFEDLRQEVVRWLEEKEKQAEEFEPVAVDVELTNAQMEQIKMVLSEYRKFAVKIDELNEVGSSYDASLKGVEITTSVTRKFRRRGISQKLTSPLGISSVHPAGLTSPGFTSTESAASSSAGVIRDNYKDLLEKLDAGKTAKQLFQRRALNRKEFEEIRSLSCEQPTKAAEQLLNLVLSQSEDFYDCFLDSLLKTDQTHVHQWIVLEDYDPEVESTAWIRDHYVFLLDTLDSVCSGLIGYLYQSKVVDREQYDDIRTERTSARQNERLLSFLGRQSPEKVQLFFNALDQTSQSHIRNTVTGRNADRSSSVTAHLSSSKERTRKTLGDLPAKMLETVLTRTLSMLCQSASSSQCPSFTLLASVCSNWHHTLTLWSHSPAGHKRKKKLTERLSRFQRSGLMQHVYTSDGSVWGVTQLRGIVYIVCRGSSAIKRFNARTHQRLKDIMVNGLSDPRDIAACKQTFQLYVADWAVDECVWRVSSDGEDVKQWVSKSPTDTLISSISSTKRRWGNTLIRLSVTSSRLLVTSWDTKQLIQFDSVGDELRRVDLPDDMDPHHAAESPTGTFIVSHFNTQVNQWQVSEVNTRGQMLRHFSGSRLLPLDVTLHVFVDSQGNVFVADALKRRILLLNSELALRRVIIDEHQLNYKRPRRLCYVEQSGQLLVGLREGDVAVFDVLRR